MGKIEVRAYFRATRDANMDRKSFEEENLVFAPIENTWHSLSSCIWAETQTQIPGKVSISTSYTILEDFFTRVLGVPKPNLSMHVQALTEFARVQADPLEIKNIIMLISLMNPTSEDLIDL